MSGKDMRKIMEAIQVNESMGSEENGVYWIPANNEYVIATEYADWVGEVYGDDIYDEATWTALSDLELINKNDDPDGWIYKLPNGQYVDTSSREGAEIVNHNPLEESKTISEDFGRNMNYVSGLIQLHGKFRSFSSSLPKDPQTVEAIKAVEEAMSNLKNIVQGIDKKQNWDTLRNFN